MAVLLLIRHGRSTANTSGTLAGWTPGIGLDETGRSGARSLASRLAPLTITRLVSSPLQRCRETAALVTEHHHGLQIEQDEGIAECRYGAWTGRRIKELTDEPLWRTVQTHPSQARFPSGGDYPAESLQNMWDRSVATVTRIDAEVEQTHGRYAVWAAVSHGDVIKAILAHALGLELEQFQRIVVGPGSLSVVHYTTERPFVLRTNDSGTQVADLLPRAETDLTPGQAVVGGTTGAGEGTGAEAPGRDDGRAEGQ